MAFIDLEADNGEKLADEGAEDNKDEAAEQEREDQEAKLEEKPKGTPVPQKQVGDIPLEVYDNGEGTYDCFYKVEAGKITIRVKLNGQKVTKSPYTLDFEEDANSDNTGVENF